MTRNLFCAIILSFALFSCSRYSGLYTPSFEGVQSVSAPGQWVHSTNFVPFIGKYANYSPYKNIGIFVDGRANNLKPQVSGAVGCYLGNYKNKTYINVKKNAITKRVGAHVDSYLGFGYQRGIEHYDDPTIFFQDINPIDFRSFRTFWQVGGHWTNTALMMNLVYRLNRFDIEKIVYFPTDDYIKSYVENIAAKNPFNINEIQGMIGFGNDRLRFTLGFNVVIPTTSAKYLNYTKFNQVQFGLSYILDTFDSN